MPQYLSKVRQITTAVGTKFPAVAGVLCDDATGAIIGKTQYISKGMNDSWPGANWPTTATGPDDNIEYVALPAPDKEEGPFL